MMDDSHDAPECLRCGACCFADTPHYVRVTGYDHERLGDFAAEFTHWEGIRCWLRMSEGHCAALHIADGQYFCKIYEHRPDICRELQRGSSQCDSERERKLH